MHLVTVGAVSRRSEPFFLCAVKSLVAPHSIGLAALVELVPSSGLVHEDLVEQSHTQHAMHPSVAELGKCTEPGKVREWQRVDHLGSAFSYRSSGFRAAAHTVRTIKKLRRNVAAE